MQMLLKEQEREDLVLLVNNYFNFLPINIELCKILWYNKYVKQKCSSVERRISYGNDNSEWNDEGLNGGKTATCKWNYGKREPAGKGRQDCRRRTCKDLRF